MELRHDHRPEETICTSPLGECFFKRLVCIVQVQYIRWLFWSISRHWLYFLFEWNGPLYRTEAKLRGLRRKSYVLPSIFHPSITKSIGGKNFLLRLRRPLKLCQGLQSFVSFLNIILILFAYIGQYLMHIKFTIYNTTDCRRPAYRRCRAS